MQLHSKTCAVVYDPVDYRSTSADWTTVKGVIRDPTCDEVILFPPLPSLGSIKHKGILQRLNLKDAKSREDLLKKIDTNKLQYDVTATRFSPDYLKEFKAAIKTENLSIDRWTWSFHGSPTFIYYGDSYSPHSSGINDNAYNAMSNDEITYEEYLAWTNGNRDNANRVFGDRTKISNPCAPYARLRNNPAKTKMIDGLLSIETESDEIKRIFNDYSLEDKTRKNNVNIKSKEVKQKLEKFYKEFQESGSCSDLFEAIKNHRLFNLCLDDNFEDNLLDVNPLSFLEKPSSHLFYSCAVSAVDDIRNTFQNDYQRLNACPQQQNEWEVYFKDILRKRLAVKLNSLCSGSPDGTQFAMSLSFPTFPDQLNSQKLSQTPSTPSNNTSIEENILKNIEHGDWTQDTQTGKNQFEDIVSTEKSSLLTKDSTRYEELQKIVTELCRSTPNLSAADKDKLRDELTVAHQLYYTSLIKYVSNIIGGVLLADGTRKKHIKFSAPELKAALTSLNDKYKKLKLNTKEEIAAAYRRLEFLMGQSYKGNGFYNCYKCLASKAQKEDCSKLKDEFQNIARLGNQEDFDKYSSPRDFINLLEKSLQSAENETPPYCAGKMPVCEFEGQTNCVKASH